MNTVNVVEKIRLGARIAISVAKLGFGVAQFVLCAAVTLFALAFGLLDERILNVNGSTVELWPPSTFYALSAVQICCCVQGLAICSGVFDRFLAVLFRRHSASASRIEMFRIPIERVELEDAEIVSRSRGAGA